MRRLFIQLICFSSFNYPRFLKIIDSKLNHRLRLFIIDIFDFNLLCFCFQRIRELDKEEELVQNRWLLYETVRKAKVLVVRLRRVCAFVFDLPGMMDNAL